MCCDIRIQIAPYEFTSDQVRFIKECFDRYKGLFPKWLELVYFEKADLSCPGDARAQYNESYRNGKIQINGSLWELDDETKRSRIVHEFLHAALTPIRRQYFLVMDNLVTDPAEKKVMNQIFTDAEERSVEDLTNIVMRNKIL